MPKFPTTLVKWNYRDKNVSSRFMSCFFRLTSHKIDPDMENSSGDVMHAVAAYTNKEKIALRKRFHILCWVGTLGMLCFLLFDIMGLSEQFSYDAIGGFGLGIAFAMLICGILFTSKYGESIRASKKKFITKLHMKSNS